jgi:beta-glucanase (GH16 family)
MRLFKRQESISDRIVNTYLFIKSLYRTIVKKDIFGKDEPETNKMDLLFEDNFKTFDEDVWRIGQSWGKFHPDATYQYYGENSVYVEDGHLVLDHRYEPRELTVWDSNKIYNIDYSIGIISTYKSFGYGFYEFECKLPKGIGLWPAVWLTGYKSWPPEIDLNESYSDGTSKYKGRLQSNIHFNLEKTKEHSGGRSHYLNVDKTVKFSLHWTENFIKLYYNGYLVRIITSKKTLRWFKDERMVIVLGNGLRKEFIDKQPKTEGSISKLEMYYAKYWK